MSVFVIRTNATWETKALAADGKSLEQLQQLVACADQTKGNLEGVPHVGDRDDVVMMYCNEEAALVEGAGFNNLGASVLDVLGYNILAFVPTAVRGPLVITGFVTEDGDDSGLTEEQVKALVDICEFAKKRNGDLKPKQVHQARMLGLCLFRGAELKAIRETEDVIKAKVKKAKAAPGAGAGAAKEENKKA